MLSEDSIKRLYVDQIKKIEVNGKIFNVVNAGRSGNDIFLIINCEEFSPKIRVKINAEADEGEYLKVYNLMRNETQRVQQLSSQPAQAPTETRHIEGELKKIEPELKFVYSPFDMIGKAVNVNLNKYGITKVNADRAYINILNLEDRINRGLRNIAKKIRLKEGDAPSPNMYVDGKMNILELIEWVKKAHKRLDYIWEKNEWRIKKLIRILRRSLGSYRDKIEENGFKNPEEAKFLYIELKKLGSDKVRKIFELKGKITENVINKRILEYEMQDKTWMHFWNLLAVAIYLINNRLIPKINQAISRQGQKGRRQQEGRVPEAAPQGEPPELEE